MALENLPLQSTLMHCWNPQQVRYG